MGGEEFGDDDLDFFLLREPDVFRVHPAKMMDHIASLRAVPPAQEFDLDAVFFERDFRLLDLDLRATVREGERQRMVEKDFHFLREKFERLR